MRLEKSCGVICYKADKQPEILVIRHRNSGHWSFAKGHVEKDETEQQTALREVLEETGLNVDILPSFREVTTYSPAINVTKEVVYFVGRVVKDDITIQKEELSEAVFLPYRQAYERITYEADKVLLKSALLRIGLEENKDLFIK